MENQSSPKITEFNPVKIFNPTGDDSPGNRLIFGGNPTNIIQLNTPKYNWGITLYKQMRDQFWIPQKIDITQDIVDYKNLDSAERKAFNGILSYLTFLDSIQTINIPILRHRITAPEVQICLAEQNSQEAMHNASYQYIIETIIPTEERNKIYSLWQEDLLLKERCSYIGQLYQNYVEKGDPESYAIALIANYILEGLYFYHGFIFFYLLASRHLMLGISDIFKLINRDELSHVRLFQNIINSSIKSFNISDDLIYTLFYKAVEHEIKWSQYITQNILGISDKSSEQYVKYLANIRLKAIGLNHLYKGVTKSPYKHLELLADTKKDGSSKTNFFESTVTSYTMSTALSDWDF